MSFSFFSTNFFGSAAAVRFFWWAANIFGTPKVDTGFVLKSFDGFKLEVPAKWNPSSEREFPGQVLKYEDNFDAVSNFTVSVTPSSKTSIKDYGSPEKFLEEVGISCFPWYSFKLLQIFSCSGTLRPSLDEGPGSNFLGTNLVSATLEI